MYCKRYERLKKDGLSPKSKANKLVGKCIVSDDVRKTTTMLLQKTSEKNIKAPHQRGLDKLFHKFCLVESLRNTDSRKGFRNRIQDSRFGLSRKRFGQGISNDKITFRTLKYTSKRIKLQGRVYAFFNKDDVSCVTAGKSKNFKK